MTSLPDPLTGASSWRTFWQSLESALAHRNPDGIAVILLDVAAFREFNRSMGVDAGNLLLRHLAGRCTANLRHARDTVARLGGDEFALMLRDIDERGCKELLERLREQLARPVEVGGRTVTPQIHLGWALFPPDAEGPEELVRLAHTRLSQEKTQASAVGTEDEAPPAPSPEVRDALPGPRIPGPRLLHPRLAQRVLEHVPEGFVCLRRDGRHLHVNNALCQLLGYEREELLARRVWEMLPGWTAEDWARHWQELRELGGMQVESTISRKDGELLQIEATPRLIVLDGEEYNCAFVHDITEHRTLEQALRLERERLAETLECITDAFYTLDRQWRFTYLNRQARRLLHVEAERLPDGSADLLGRVVWEAFPGVVGTSIEHEFRRAMNESLAVHFETHYRPLATRFEIHAYPTEEGLAVFFRDVTERHRTEQEIEFLALYDPLTGLANRKLLSDRLHQALAESARTRVAGAVVLLDLDHFRGINDTLGHEHGDLLLQHVAARLKECLRENDTVARFGGDEFVVVAGGLNSVEAPQQARQLAAKVFEALRAAYIVEGVAYYVTPSLGAALYGVDGAASTPQELLKRADLAMHEAKEAGGNTLRLFDPSMESSANERVQLEREIREGIPRGEFLPYYQPRVDHTGCVLAQVPQH